MDSKIKAMLLKLATENPGVAGKFKIAAAIVYRGHLIATGVNGYKTHPIMLQFGYREGQIFLHAEADAIRKALKLLTQDELGKSELYVVRVKKDTKGKFQEALAKPCKGCQHMIANFGIPKVEWTEDE